MPNTEEHWRSEAKRMAPRELYVASVLRGRFWSFGQTPRLRAMAKNIPLARPERDIALYPEKWSAANWAWYFAARPAYETDRTMIG